jgi:type III secretion protein I
MTDISGIQQVVQKIVEQGVGDQAQNAAVDKGSAAAGDVEKFQAALAQSPAEPQAVNPTANAEAPAKIEGVTEVEETSPGQKILDNVEQLRSGFHDTMNQVQQLIDKGTASPAEMLAVQAKLQTMTLQQDMLAKVVGKSEQNIDTMLKGQ